MKKLNLTTKVLNMPEAGVVVSTMKLIQAGCCDAILRETVTQEDIVTDCDNLDCAKCIYSIDNLPEFTEFWRRSHPVPHNLHKL